MLEAKYLAEVDPQRYLIYGMHVIIWWVFEIRNWTDLLWVSSSSREPMSTQMQGKQEMSGKPKLTSIEKCRGPGLGEHP